MFVKKTEQVRAVLNVPLHIPEDEIEFTAVRAQGAGGQNVNKVSSAAHLRFDIRASSLPDCVKERLLKSGDHRISKDGVAVIKAQTHRSLERNKEEALARLHEMIAAAATRPKVRRPTKPTRGAQQRRLEKKNIRSDIKTLRGKVAH